MRILAVDDDELAIEMLQMALAQSGHDVIATTDSTRVLPLMHENKCRMLITDWKMPGLSGIDLCRAIRTDDMLGYVYIIILTGCNTPEEVVEGMSAGADDFIRKPFNPEELAVRVHAGERILSLETRDMVLFSLAKLAESRDPDTGHHLERVQDYCGIVARQMKLKSDEPVAQEPAFVRMIFQTSPLHDVGKIGIPDCVLLKPGRLSDREFDIMKAHTTLGADTLNAALQQFPEAAFLRMARDIAAAHHERFDGTGYPTRLAGRDIPLSARVVALADVYDALTSRRVYKSAFTHDVARSIIIDESGTHFDPDVVQAFVDTEEQFINVRRKLGECEELCKPAFAAAAAEK